MQRLNSQVRADRPYATVNPYTGEAVAQFPFLESDQLGEVIGAAHQSFLAWRRRDVHERAAIVRRAGELILERKAHLADLLTLEVGKLISQSYWEVELAASILSYYGANGPRYLGEQVLPVDVGSAVVANEPLGVLLGIEPWNFPLYQVARFAAPNLVLGNTVLLKHAESCPQSALALVDVFADAGAPAGVYTNIFLRVSDVPSVIEHSDVRGVSLTGSEEAGSSVAAAAGGNLKKSVLELGGSDPFIVLDAVDLDRTVAPAAFGRLANTGQSCVAAKRFVVVESVFDDFVSRLAKSFESLEMGDPADPATTLGPLSSTAAVAALDSQVSDATAKGADAVVGGGPANREGAFYEPTILTKVTSSMRAFSEELFGPVAAVYQVVNDDAAIDLANGTSYGLGGSVFCTDLERARAVADRLDCGMVWINAVTSTLADLPFGGVKRSGYGRELSPLGLFEFANRKLIRTLCPEE